ncbi:ChaN family lipoprotein [Hydrogenophaga sp. A37]|uniref:ChaN family lipoprotein n=1 Tax=Hydrogenophaga sp. A37 TaxID=1945864 RepID=UPI0009851447|nr:ChaN family lipoprotein [Hydrogenophaga sp. A37]OOG81162.1 hypothetical protein B0E41_18660 [Hydrogenophaga sp. A37]
MNCQRAVMAWVGAVALLAGCAAAPSATPELQGLLPTPLLLLGEQHDAPEQQALQRATVRQLAQQGQLVAVVLEMVEQGRQTTGLPSEASEAKVREALDWREASNSGAWDWAVYGPVVMAAVRAGVPVLGGNLPRAQMRAAMADVALDASVPPDTLQRQRDAIRDGHCGLLPETQIAPMTRIQLARDRAMAQTATGAMRPGLTVLLIAGNGHVQRDIGVPRHLDPGQSHRVVLSVARAEAASSDPEMRLTADRLWVTPPRPPKDHCADLKKQTGR